MTIKGWEQILDMDYRKGWAVVNGIWIRKG